MSEIRRTAELIVALQEQVTQLQSKLDAAEDERKRTKLEAAERIAELETRLGAALAIVRSEDWPALETMGQHATAVKNETLLDLADALIGEGSAVEEHAPGCAALKAPLNLCDCADEGQCQHDWLHGSKTVHEWLCAKCDAVTHADPAEAEQLNMTDGGVLYRTSKEIAESGAIHRFAGAAEQHEPGCNALKAPFNLCDCAVERQEPK